MVNADSVDKEVIIAVVKLGCDCSLSSDYETAKFVGRCCFYMLLQGTNITSQHPSDTRTALAMRCGIIEMLLTMMHSFRSHMFDQESLKDPSLFTLKNILSERIEVIVSNLQVAIRILLCWYTKYTQYISFQRSFDW